VKIVERIPEHYEVQEVEDLGRTYRWCPEQVVLECDACGTRMTHKRSNLVTARSLRVWGEKYSESARGTTR
jgi:hypothetical protein